MFPGRTARVNACALLGDDLFITNDGPDSQCIFRLPAYLIRGGLAAAEAFVVTLDGSGYVGVALDAAGNLYTAEGVGGANHIVRYTGIADGYPGLPAALLDNFGSRADLGDAGAASFFADLAIDGAGNLWVSDAANHRVVVFDAAQLGAANTFHVLSNVTGQIAAANTTPTLGGFAQHLFASPEGVDFDMHGNLWVANNNDGANNVQNTRTSLVQLTPAQEVTLMTEALDTVETLVPALGIQDGEEVLFLFLFVYEVYRFEMVFSMLAGGTTGG